MTQAEMVDEYFAVEWAMRLKVEPPIDDTHPSADQSGRHPTDGDLRDCGCKIVQRKKGREAVWTHPDWGRQAQSDMLHLVGLVPHKPLRGGLGK